jgi:erythromycin esterase-like protein
VNRFVRGHGEDVTAEEALRGFERFPSWMWRNHLLDFVGWLREHNDRFGGHESARTGFYGLDPYCLYRSIQELISYLERVDPAAAARARERYACFDHYGDGFDGQAVAFGAGRPLRGVVCLSGARPPTRTFDGSTAQRTGRDRPPHPR